MKDFYYLFLKVNVLEMELDDQKDKFRNLEDSMSNGEKSLKRKVSQLEKNVEDLTMMYHQVIVNINASKMNAQVIYKKNIFFFLS